MQSKGPNYTRGQRVKSTTKRAIQRDLHNVCICRACPCTHLPLHETMSRSILRVFPFPWLSVIRLIQLTGAPSKIHNSKQRSTLLHNVPLFDAVSNDICAFDVHRALGPSKYDRLCLWSPCRRLYNSREIVSLTEQLQRRQ